MGGKALSQYGVETERVDTEILNKYYDFISEIIQDNLRIDTYAVQCYSQKETHGDLDILLRIDNDFHNSKINLVDWIQETFSPKAIYNNGGVISWEFNDFQIDFIPIRESIWEMSKAFFNASPLGNLLGKVSHKFGMKYGWEGLVYVFRNFNGREAQNILISKDPKKIFKFLGFDYNRYLQGFDTEQEIFDFVINSKYFCSDTFQMENLRHIDRKRNQKRPDYNRFISYINDNGINTNYDFLPKEEYIPIIAEFFPEADLINKIEQLTIKDNNNQILSKKFNGKIVMEYYPNLKDKQLGHTMTKFKEHLGDWENIFLHMDIDEIMTEFDNYICSLNI